MINYLAKVIAWGVLAAMLTNMLFVYLEFLGFPVANHHDPKIAPLWLVCWFYNVLFVYLAYRVITFRRGR